MSVQGLELLQNYIIQMLFTPYRWGGNTIHGGIDCSGLAIEVLNAFGFDLSDQTAHDLWIWCKKSNFNMVPMPGSLVFYGSKSKVTHVGVLITEFLMVEAGGGDSTTVSATEADRKGAFVRIRPMARRKDLIGIYYPPYSFGETREL